MKHLYYLFLMVLAMLALPSCLKEGDKTILVNDPQDIPFITDYLPDDLLDMFGEENVHFGDQPPVIDMEFMSLQEDDPCSGLSPSDQFLACDLFQAWCRHKSDHSR